MNYFCIGNSHVYQFGENFQAQDYFCNKNFRGVSIGGCVAYNFLTSHLVRTHEHLIKFGFNSSKETLILIVGEVDCRYHLPKQAELQKRQLIDITVECVDRYFHSIMEFSNVCNVIAWGVHPSSIAPHREGGHIYGSMELRNYVSVLFNKRLRELCEWKKIQFRSIYHHLVNSCNVTKMEYYIDDLHLNSHLVKNFINLELSI